MENFQALKSASVKKRTNIRYACGVHFVMNLFQLLQLIGLVGALGAVAVKHVEAG